MDALINLGIFAGLLAIGYFSGTWAERRHYRSIRRREEEFLGLPAVTLRSAAHPDRVVQARLVAGSAVISVDYFKRFLAGLRALVGGRVKAYESLLDRARREAVLRMKEQAPSADVIVNLRIETSSIAQGRRQKGLGTVEALAYGTALRLRPE